MDRSRRRAATLLAAGALGAAMTTSCGNGTLASGTKRLTLAHALSSDHPVHEAMVFMKARVEDLSGGALKLDLYPNGQLGQERELIELVQIGAVSITKVSALSLEGFLPAMKLFSVPYLFRGPDHFWLFLTSETGQGLLDQLRAIRLQGLGYYDAGSRSFYTSKIPVTAPSDLKGQKIRVIPSRMAIDMIEALGGSATPISWGELYTALQQGVVDGAENNLPSYFLSNHFEAAPFLTLDEHTSVPDIVVMNAKARDQLSAQERAWLQTAMDESVVFQRQRWREASQEALAKVKAAGVNIITPDKALFRSAVSTLRDRQRQMTIGPLIEAVELLAQGA